jgi:hypothetical protein
MGAEVCFIRNTNSSALNNFGGWCNVPNYPNFSAFATLKSDGSIMAWGSPYAGGAGAPSGSSWYSHYQRVHLHLQNPGHPTP